MCLLLLLAGSSWSYDLKDFGVVLSHTLCISSILTLIAFDSDFRQGFRIEFDTLIYTTFAPS
jgi:hypothetical protein